jgi:hypothetical protein
VGTPEFRDHPLHDRLARVLERALGRSARISAYGRPVAQTGEPLVLGANAYLYVVPDEPEVELSVYPADTLEQARAFYRQADVLASVRRLRSAGQWRATPNFHFGHFQRGYCWTCNERDLEEYLALWVRRIPTERAVPRVDWDAYWAWLESERIACPSDWPEFERHFVNTNRASASPRPGLAVWRRWPLELAQRRGREDDLAADVRAAILEARAAFPA